MQLKKILLPVDGSKNSERAIEYAVTIGSDEASEILILNVVDSKRYTSLPEDALTQDRELIVDQEGERVTQNAKKIIESFDEAKDLKITTMTIEGHPATIIDKVSKNENIDLIVMASSGKHMVNRFLLGSVTEKTIRQSNVPVLVVPPED